MGHTSIDDAVDGDPRYAELAHHLGLADADHAIGKVRKLWKLCRETQHYTLSQATVTALLGPRGVEALLASRLAELVTGHLPGKWAEPLERRPTPAAPGEPVVRMRGSKKRVDAAGQQVIAASMGGFARARKARALPGSTPGGRPSGRPDTCGQPVEEPVGNPVTSLLTGVPGGTPTSAGPHAGRIAGRHEILPGGTPGGERPALRGGMPTCAPEEDQITKRTESEGERRPALGALRVVGADRERSGS